MNLLEDISDNIDKAYFVDLFVRASNAPAIKMYEKMSKSPSSLGPKHHIANKIKRCKTDSLPGLEFDNPERPECTNLLSIYQLISRKTKEVRYRKSCPILVIWMKFWRKVLEMHKELQMQHLIMFIKQ